MADAAAHTPFATVHTNELLPAPKPVAGDDGLLTEETEPPPDPTDQVPVPTDGITAFKVVPEAQIVWLLPALAVGCTSREIITDAVADGQLPLATVHKNELVPVPNDVICVNELFTEVILPEPESNDQVPVPGEGAVAFNVADVAQTV